MAQVKAKEIEHNVVREDRPGTVPGGVSRIREGTRQGARPAEGQSGQDPPPGNKAANDINGLPQPPMAEPGEFDRPGPGPGMAEPGEFDGPGMVEQGEFDEFGGPSSGGIPISITQGDDAIPSMQEERKVSQGEAMNKAGIEQANQLEAGQTGTSGEVGVAGQVGTAGVVGTAGAVGTAVVVGTTGEQGEKPEAEMTPQELEDKREAELLAAELAEKEAQVKKIEEARQGFKAEDNAAESARRQQEDEGIILAEEKLTESHSKQIIAPEKKEFNPANPEGDATGDATEGAADPNAAPGSQAALFVGTGAEEGKGTEHEKAVALNMEEAKQIEDDMLIESPTRPGATQAAGSEGAVAANTGEGATNEKGEAVNMGKEGDELGAPEMARPGVPGTTERTGVPVSTERPSAPGAQGSEASNAPGSENAGPSAPGAENSASPVAPGAVAVSNAPGEQDPATEAGNDEAGALAKVQDVVPTEEEKKAEKIFEKQGRYSPEPPRVDLFNEDFEKDLPQGVDREKMREERQRMETKTAVQAAEIAAKVREEEDNELQKKKNEQANMENRAADIMAKYAS